MSAKAEAAAPAPATSPRFRWWPRSLLWRAFPLFAVLMLISGATWFFLVHHYEREPRARQLAQLMVSVVNLTRVSLLSARADARHGLLRELSDREGIHIYPVMPGETIEPLPAQPFLQRVHELLREKLGAQTRMTLMRDGEKALFVSFRIDEDDDIEFWVAIPRERLERGVPLALIGWSVLVFLLSLSGAWLISMHVVKPLKALRQAAEKLGAGEAAPRLAENGTEEISAVSVAFNRMAADLQQLDQDRALILAGVSHDLRTPLTRLRMGIEMTSDSEMREGMVADVEEMDKTIAQFLDFARSGNIEGQAPEGHETIVVADFVRELAEQYARHHHAVAIGRLASSGLVVSAKPQALRRALSNLLDNALRYAPGQAPDLAAWHEERHVVFEVRDHGPGVPDEAIERLKRPFTRLDAARGNTVGAGLGLAIVERIAQAHGGALQLANAPGGGLSARLSLPHQ